MYQHTTAVANEIAKPSRTWGAKIVFGSPAVTNTNIITAVLTSGANDGDNFIIGGNTASQLDLQINGEDNIPEAGEKFQLYFGVYVNGTPQWEPEGTFIAVGVPKVVNNITSIVAYDAMNALLTKAYQSDLTYTSTTGPTVAQILAEIATKSGVLFNSNSVSAEISSYIIKARNDYDESSVDEYGSIGQILHYVNPFDGYTYREALGYLAALAGAFVTVNRNGEAEFRRFNLADTSVNTNVSADRYYDDLNVDITQYSTEVISCDTPKGALKAGSGTDGIVISNPLMTQAWLNTALSDVSGIAFYPSSVSFLGDNGVDLGDNVVVTKPDNTTTIIPVMKVVQEYDGGLLTRVYSYAGGFKQSISTTQGPTITLLNRYVADLAVVKEVVAGTARVEDLSATRATIGSLTVDDGQGQTVINGAKIATGTITATQISSGAITTDKLDAGAVTASKIASGTITATQIASGTITATQLASGAVTTDKLDAGAVTTAKLDSGAVTTDKLDAGAVTAAKISVTDLSALGATIGGMVIGADSLHTTGKTTYDSSVAGVYIDNEGQFGFGDDDAHIRFYKDANDNWKFEAEGIYKIGDFSNWAKVENSIVKIAVGGVELANYAADAIIIGNTASKNVLIDANTGVHIRNGGNTLAQFSTSVILGESSAGHVTITDHLFEMSDMYGTNQIAVIGDLRDADGQSDVSETFVADGDSRSFRTEFEILDASASNVSATVNGVSASIYSVTSHYVDLTTVPAVGATVVITYKTEAEVPYYTFGTRLGSSVLGAYSFAEGRGATASGVVSHAEAQATASGKYSHAEGMSEASEEYAHAEGRSHASGPASHAEGLGVSSGQYSHAEGYRTFATGEASHSEGIDAEAFGIASHAQNFGTIANKVSQTAIGVYNISDTNSDYDASHYMGGKYALIIGNGTSDSARSNALTVGWDGTLTAAGIDLTTLQTGTITFSANMTNWSSTLRKFGRVCVLKLNATTTVARSSGSVMATLPVGFRPDSITDLNTRLNNGSNGIIELGTDGTVKCMNSMSSGDGYRAIMTFVV